jgi:hypothetical protein
MPRPAKEAIYMFGRSHEEIRRLIDQAPILRPTTERERPDCMSADLSGGVSFESSNCREAANDDDSPSRKLVTLINLFTVGRPNQQQLKRAILLSDLCRKRRDSRRFWRKLGFILN